MAQNYSIDDILTGSVNSGRERNISRFNELKDTRKAIAEAKRGPLGSALGDFGNRVMDARVTADIPYNDNDWTVRDLATLGMEMAPVSGDAVAIDDARRAWGEGKKGLAALYAASTAPVAGPVVLGGSKLAMGAMPFLAGAVKPTRMSRKAAEDAGYWHDIGAGKKLKRPFSELRATREDVVDMPPEVEINPETMQGGILIPASGDRTDAGKIVTSIGDTELINPVRLEGGRNFMRENPESAWASAKGKATSLTNKAREGIEEGRDAFLVYMPMSHGTTDFNAMMSDALLEQIRDGKVSKTAQKHFDIDLRKVRPEWKGIDNPESMSMLESNGALRQAFADVANMEYYQRRGFPDMAETRYALTDPALMDVPLHQGGQSIAKTTGEIVADPAMPHKTYNTQISGDYVGGISGGVPRQVLFPSFENARRAAGKSPRSDYRAFDLSNPVQIADQEWVDGVMKYLESQRR